MSIEAWVFRAFALLACVALACYLLLVARACWCWLATARPT
eukprot:CAMPEP_0179181436 /NCGR_PEP_ID=MMETSP0796-20121207/89860_1 /TAXON_ID=73915 /ORGANISM="Pyrodinium bahamense, Strain pbaha01" /LENGTH=40 /DNA_ID= /DNA_START= /DNA_END= /DNA_ORIENTATION=